MKTAGVLPEALAAAISRFSRSELDAIPNSRPIGERQPDPTEVIEIDRGQYGRVEPAGVSNRRPRRRCADRGQHGPQQICRSRASPSGPRLGPDRGRWSLSSWARAMEWHSHGTPQ
jgi:hypothetical protein